MEVLNSLGALGFWIFIAAIVVAGIWSDARKREIQQETLRRIVESGKDIDAAMLDKLIAAGRGDERPDKDLKTSGIIMLFIAPGLAVLGYFMGQLAEELFSILLGVSLLVAFIGIGMMVAGKVSERGYNEDKG
jgi:uncharacterized membrane protein